MFEKLKRKNGLASLEELYFPEAGFVWTEIWWLLIEEQDLRVDIQKELNSEIGRKHPLWGLKPVVFAKSNCSDDVLVHLNDSRVACVHLIWHGHIDQ